MQASNQVARPPAFGTGACRHRNRPQLTPHRAKTAAAAAEVQAENLATRADGIWSFSATCEANATLVSVPREAWLTTDLVDASAIGSATTGAISDVSLPLSLVTKRTR